MNSFKKSCAFLILIFIALSANSQKFKELIGPSPAATAFSKYTDIPANNYTGVPNIEIPIYNIQTKGLELPLNLSYHAGGFRVDEEAGRSGLGWVLNAGGVINRSVNGDDDFLPIRGYLNSPIPGFWSESATHAIATGNNLFVNTGASGSFVVSLYGQQLDLTQYLPSAADWEGSKYDMEPDVFNYNFNGFSGKFTIKKNKDVELQGPSGVSVRLLDNNGSRWLIITPDGVKYYFDKPEYCEFLSGGATKRYITSWYLTKIESLNGDAILLDYTTEESIGIKTYNSISEKYNLEVIPISGSSYIRPHPGSMTVSYPPIKVYSPTFLKSINFPSGSVTFDYSSRIDVNGDKRLSKIFINNQTHPSSSFYYELLYDYFTATPNGYTIPDPEANMNQDLFNKRLKLVALEKKSQSGILPGEKFQFFYNNLELPSKKSLARDFWGFYNGQTTNSTLLPAGPYFSYNTPGQTVSYPNGANRKPSETYCKASVLREIMYPTGGKTIFEFESNDYDLANSLTDPSTGSELNTEQKNFFTRRGVDESFNIYFPEVISGSKIIFNINSENGQTIAYPYPRDDDAFFEIYAASNLTTPIVRTLLGYESFWIKNNSDPSNLKYYRDDQFSLPAGNYVIKTHIASNVSFLNYVRFSFKYTYVKDMSNSHTIEKGGGLRVSSITNLDPASNISHTKKFNYHYNYDYDGNGVAEECSYGRSLSPLEFAFFEEFANCGNDNLGNAATSSSVLYNLYSQSRYSFNQPIVGYDKVRTWFSDSLGSGYSDFEFINIPDIKPAYQVPGNEMKLGPPGVSGVFNLSNGSLIRQRDYVSRNSSSFFLQREVINTYSDTLKNTHAGFIWVWPYDGTCPLPAGAGFRLLQYPAFQTTWNRLKKQIIKEYAGFANNEEPLVSETGYEYEGETPRHFRPVKTIRNNSNGTVSSKIDIYPDDYDNNTPWIKDMKLLNIKFPIEQVQLINNNVVSGDLHIYKSGGNGLLETQQNIHFDNSVPLSIFKFSNRLAGVFPPSGTISSFSPDIHYKDFVKYNQYSAKGNILEMQKVNDVKEVYLWGYNAQYPVAKIVGQKTYAEIISQSGIDTVQLRNPANDASLRSYLNALRSIGDVQVFTYTYKPLVGMTSETDPAGRITYYEYDSFGRLSKVKDDQGNIVKHICYNYAGQVINCNQ